MTPLEWLPVITAGGLVINALRLRDRLSSLRRVRPADPRAAAADYALVTGEQVKLDHEVRSAAVEFAARHRQEVVDLIPFDLPVERAMDFARSVDTRSYSFDLIGQGAGVGHATVVTHRVLAAAEVEEGPCETGEYAATTVRLKQYARAAGFAVVPGPSGPPGSRRAWLRGLGRPLPILAALQLGSWALVLLGLLVNPLEGLACLVVYSCVPVLVFAAGPLNPGDLRRASLLRIVEVPLSWLRMLFARRGAWEVRRAVRIQEARRYYRQELMRGVGRFLEPRRLECPWCGSQALARHLSTFDIVRGKPGRFTLERCGDCGHIFQNPRLTPEGLDFYYRDVYDGLGAEESDRVFGDQAKCYRARAETVRAATTPRTWLDVGTGRGHFCREAAAILPTTVFDGLDIGDGVEEAARRGWIRRAYKGQFTELVDELAGRYDVISMHHYLEHTRDPFGELDAVVKVLGPGGFLFVELPDPESPFARFLGRYWLPWFSPQHQHMLPIENLKRALTARGMEIVTETRREAQHGPDLPCAALVALNRLGPDPGRPWAARRPSILGWARRALAFALAGPVLVLAFGAQTVIWPFVRSHANAYRVLARKGEG
jgi:SAM-dependent methyltransferase